MGIDRPDEDDAPTVKPDSPAAERYGAPDADPDPAYAAFSDSPADRAAEHIRYRAVVECERARQVWAEALPEFRATWEEHQEKYPHPERTAAAVQADGSWRGDGDRELSSTRNSEATRACAEIGELAKDDILPAIRRIEAADSDRQLAGLEHWLKGEDRLKEKVADRLRYRPELAVRQALAEVPDAVRFTLAYGEVGYAEGVRTDVQRLKAEGFELIKLKNSWNGDQYKGINSQWQRPESGLRFEVQFHTQASFEAKQLTHQAYERLRSPVTAKDEEEALIRYQRQVNTLIPPVSGAAEIENYPPEKRNG